MSQLAGSYQRARETDCKTWRLWKYMGSTFLRQGRWQTAHSWLKNESFNDRRDARSVVSHVGRQTEAEGARRRLDREGPRSKCAISALLFLPFLPSFLLSFLPPLPISIPIRTTFAALSTVYSPQVSFLLLSSFCPNPLPFVRFCCPNIRAVATSQVRFFLPSITACGHRMAHRKWKETKLHPSMLPGLALPGCTLVSFHFL